MRVARFTSTMQQSDLRQHSTLIGKVHLSFSSQPSYFLPQPAFSTSSSASLSSFVIQPQYLIPFSRHDHPLSSTHHETMVGGKQGHVLCQRFISSCFSLTAETFYGANDTAKKNELNLTTFVCFCDATLISPPLDACRFFLFEVPNNKHEMHQGVGDVQYGYCLLLFRRCLGNLLSTIVSWYCLNGNVLFLLHCQ